jgi:putative addiction module CopG family antidote
MATQDTELQAYIDQKVASGEFGSAEDLAAEAIRVYRHMETDYELLRSEVQNRIKRADAGDLLPMDMEAIKEQLQGKRNINGSPK